LIKFLFNQKTTKTAEFNYLFSYYLQTKVKLTMMMQYINCAVKAHKVQTVKLTLYKYNSWPHVQCVIRDLHCWLLYFTIIWKCAD